MSKQMLWGAVLMIVLLAGSLLLFRCSDLQNESYNMREMREAQDWDRIGTSGINWV